MKKLALLLILALGTPQAMADARNTITWEVFGLRVGGAFVNFFDLDVEIGNNYVHMYGAVDFADGFSTPANGSCFFPSGEGFLFCNLNVGENAVVLSIDEDFDGTVESVDADGFLEDDGFLTFLGIL
ncbi:MAG: hypothetical protein RL120_19035 [Gammaproteobacteria bacterium]